jgi:beta-lactamase regulating signal transducer with metallopeptidase domain
VLGFLRPRILLPAELLERLTAAELAQVVVHEMEHLRRGDDWTNLLQKLALVVFPLNPALWWVESQLCAERELACDDQVIRASRGRKAYAICLTHLAEYSMLRRGLSLALGAWEKQSELVRRVHRILRRPGATMSLRRTMALTAGLMLEAWVWRGVRNWWVSGCRLRMWSRLLLCRRLRMSRCGGWRQSRAW